MINKRRILVITIPLVLILLTGLLLLIFRRTPVTATLSMSPSSAKAVLDNKTTIKPGSLRLKPGKHSITASFGGFKTTTTSFTIAPIGTAPVKKIVLLLATTSQEGVDYIANNSEEQGNRESIGGKAYAQTSQDIQDTYPIVKQLPYIGPGNTYRIDYGPDPDDDSSNSLQILITYYTTDGQQSALDWISSQGYDPNNLPIAYDDQTSDASATQPDNPYTN